MFTTRDPARIVSGISCSIILWTPAPFTIHCTFTGTTPGCSLHSRDSPFRQDIHFLQMQLPRCSRTFRRWETSRFTGLLTLVVGISGDSAELFEEHEPLFIQRLETVSIVPDHVVPRQSTTCLLVLSNSDLARGPLSWHTPQIKTRLRLPEDQTSI
ncbi:hypothetical protein BKA83DRAFT_4340597 [Pisolithus microcarpus]|nr:hypothetical protein BKA83DRAFT_4340597 [Pisolithus microcarpus]